MKRPFQHAILAGIVLLSAHPLVARADDTARAGVRGRVVDAGSKEPLAGALVQVLDGGSQKTRTGDDGRYRLALPPGAYVLRIYYPLYEGRRVENVFVTRGTVLDIDVALPRSDAAIQEVLVLAEPERRTEEGVLELRKRSGTVSDALSAQEMSRTPDSSASDAVKRVVSATVVDGKYVMLRGLGGRYVTTLLNGVTLPSPEPDKQAVPLDLFPTSLLANLTIAKSYSVDSPGAFGGGTLKIETDSYPDDFKLSLKASTSADTSATLAAQQDYRGGNLDFLGIDDGSRRLPSSVPSDRPARSASGLDPATMEDIGESFSDVWSARERTAYPNLGLGATVGDTLEKKGRKLGYLASLSFGHRLDGKDADVAKVKTSDAGVEYREQMESVSGSEAAKVGGLMALGFQPAKNQSVDLISLYTHTGTSTAENVTGLNETDGLLMDSTRLRFVERSLSFTQIQTRHRLPALGGLELRWQGNLALTSRDEPDTRDIKYNVLGDGRERFKNDPGSGERYFSRLDETSIGTGLDLTAPVLPRLRLKAGTMVQRSNRTFSARRFRFTFVGTDPSVLFLPPEEMLSAENIGPSFRLQEQTLQSDAYDADLLLYAGYGAVEVQPVDKLRLEGGLRYEVSTQEMTPGSPFAIGDLDPSDVTSRSDRDALPAVSAVYSLTSNMNLRAAYSYSLARPQFRELAPFLYFDYTRRRAVSGNPNLVETRIHNADLRWEWFAGDTDVFAASLFYKRFKDPIEQVIVSATNGDVSYANAEGAQTVGAELEARTSLGRLAPALSPLRVWGNLALIRSRIQLGEDQVMSQTSAERPLQGQSPYSINVGLGYSRDRDATDVTLLYNVFGPRIDEVGFDSLPDVYEQPFHRVDLAASQGLGGHTKLKLAATNILNQPVVLEQGGLSIYRYRPGVGFSLALEWTR